MNNRKIAEEIFRAGVNAVLPSVLIPSRVTLRDNTLFIGNNVFSLDLVNDIYLIGAGKASALMAAEMEKILGRRIREGHIITKYGHSCRLKYISVTEAGHPVPDANGYLGTSLLLDIAQKASSDDLVICLISGGGSALLADYPEGSTPGEMNMLNDILVNSGACISEINAVRKHLSNVKGGLLARAVYPARLISLILSDVPGDPVEVIASGPTSPDPTTYTQALDVLTKYDLLSSVPQSLLDYLNAGIEGLYPETPDAADVVFERTSNILIGSNRVALEAARLEALNYNMNAVVADEELQGDFQSIAEYVTGTAMHFMNDKAEVKPLCLLFGGETTVKMTGNGAGGRNQHIALSVSMMLKDIPGITFLSAGTDGTDGPTDAAGAVVDSDTCRFAKQKGINPEDYLRRFDSYHFFKKAGGHIITGPTMTNVMDIIIVILSKPEMS